MKCDVLILGGGTGGVAAALVLARSGLTVILTEATDWLGGQFTSQMVPPDEHPWIESFGCTRRYRWFRQVIRKEYVSNRPTFKPSQNDGTWPDLTFNPGGGWVSRICHEPAIGAQALQSTFQALDLWPRTMLQTVPVGAEIVGSVVRSVTVKGLVTGEETRIDCRFVIDATELGDALPLTGTDYIVGAESKEETGEPHAAARAEPDNVQGFTWCAALEYDLTGNHTINKPNDYDFWSSYVPPHWTGRLLDLTFPNVRTGKPMTLPLFGGNSHDLTLFGYRQIVDPTMYISQVQPVTVMNWPQNDYMLGSVIDAPVDEIEKHYESSKNLTLSVVYWLQTEMGYPGLRLRPDIAHTADGLAKAPYHRESRRIKALRTIKEQDVSPDCHPGCKVSPPLWDAIGVGAYRIDLHPSANGAKTIDVSSLPFQIPLGALIPVNTRNLIPACKNIGTTHVTNGCYRLHPVEWNIGEAAGLLSQHCLETNMDPQELYGQVSKVEEFQRRLVNEGVELSWPEIGPL